LPAQTVTESPPSSAPEFSETPSDSAAALSALAAGNGLPSLPSAAPWSRSRLTRAFRRRLGISSPDLPAAERGRPRVLPQIDARAQRPV